VRESAQAFEIRSKYEFRSCRCDAHEALDSVSHENLPLTQLDPGGVVVEGARYGNAHESDSIGRILMHAVATRAKGRANLRP